MCCSYMCGFHFTWKNAKRVKKGKPKTERGTAGDGDTSSGTPGEGVPPVPDEDDDNIISDGGGGSDGSSDSGSSVVSDGEDEIEALVVPAETESSSGCVVM